MTLLIIVLWVSAAWLTFGALATISMIGKERKPLTSGIATTTIVTSGVIVAAIVSAAIVLS